MTPSEVLPAGLHLNDVAFGGCALDCRSGRSTPSQDQEPSGLKLFGDGRLVGLSENEETVFWGPLE